MRYLVEEHPSSEEERQMSKSSGVILLNRAACRLKLKQFDLAISDCKTAISKGEDTAKAHFRLGQAYLGSKDMDAAKLELTKAHDLAPDDKAISSLLDKIKKDVVEQRKKEADKYKRMFS